MCTSIRFTSKSGEMFFGRNLDWTKDYGQKVVIIPRGYKYQSAFLGEIGEHPAIIGMGVVADNTPLFFDCANEHGLAIAGLNFPDYTTYAPDAIDGKTNIAAYEFPLWVTLNFTSVEEVKEALKNAAIIAKPINPEYPVSKLHWLIGDAQKSIVIECTDQGVEAFDNEFDVLANLPNFPWHRENIRNYMNLFSEMPKEIKWGESTLAAFGAGSLTQGLPGDCYSPSRFVRAAYYNSHYPTQSGEAPNISRLFHTLAGVAMIDGAAIGQDGAFERTLYTSGYSASTKTYYYNTYDDPDVKSTTLSDYNLDSTEIILA